MAEWWRASDDGVVITVRAMPGAKRSEARVDGEVVRIRLAAPAVEGKANAELVRFVADAFGVRRSAVTLVAGDRSRDKVVAVAGVSGPPTAWLNPE